MKKDDAVPSDRSPRRPAHRRPCSRSVCCPASFIFFYSYFFVSHYGAIMSYFAFSRSLPRIYTRLLLDSGGTRRAPCRRGDRARISSGISRGSRFRHASTNNRGDAIPWCHAIARASTRVSLLVARNVKRLFCLLKETLLSANFTTIIYGDDQSGGSEG